MIIERHGDHQCRLAPGHGQGLTAAIGKLVAFGQRVAFERTRDHHVQVADTIHAAQATTRGIDRKFDRHIPAPTVHQLRPQVGLAQPPLHGARLPRRIGGTADPVHARAVVGLGDGDQAAGSGIRLHDEVRVTNDGAMAVAVNMLLRGDGVGDRGGGQSTQGTGRAQKCSAWVKSHRKHL